MAIVAKSIIYAWPTVTSSITLANTASLTYTTASFGSKTIYFPETSSRVFKSVYAEVAFHDDIQVSTDGGLASLKLDLSISGSSTSSSILWNPAIPTSGENMSFVGGPFDFTSFFNTNIPTVSSSINLIPALYYYPSVGTASLMQNANFKLYCTYEHDDINTTYIKTAIIPLESPITGLSSGTIQASIIGNNQIPRLITSSSLDTSQVDNSSFGFTQSGSVRVSNFISNYTITNSGSYRVTLTTGLGDIPPTFVSASIYNSSSGELLYKTSGGDQINFDQYVFISSSSLPTKLRFLVTGDNDYNGGNYQIYLSQSVLFPGFLPESNINIRDYFIEIEGNESGGATVDIQITGSITSSFANLSTRFTPLERSQTSDTYDRLIWSIPTSSLPNIFQSHNFGLRTNIASNASFRHVPINLYVTYEYDKTTTTQVNNTIVLPWSLPTPLTPNGTDFILNSSVATTVLPIFETNPILQQSALRINWDANNSLTTAYVTINNQSITTSYTDGGAALCGMNSLQHRFDVSASNANANTANVVLRRGLNYLTSSFFANSGATYATNINGYYIINYTSNIHPTKGVDGCVRNYYFLNDPINARTAITTPTYTSSSFYYNTTNSGSLYVIDNSYRVTTFDQNNVTRYDAGVEYTGSEVGGIFGVYPMVNLYRNNILTDAELGAHIVTITGNPFVKKYTNQPNPLGLYDTFIPHQYRFYWESPAGTSISTRYGSQNILVANSYTAPISGRIFNYTGSGQGINIDIFNQTTEQLLLQLTSSIGGTFSGTIFDDGSPIFASVTTGDTYGRSKALNVSSSLDVYLIPFEYGYSNI
jgi:hypothetical protein